MNDNSNPRSGISLRNLRIGTRLALAFAAMLVLMMAAIAMGLRGLDSVYGNAHTAFAQNVELAKHASQIDILVLNERRFEKDTFINMADPAKVESYQQKWKDANAELAQEIAAALAVAVTDEDKATLEQIATNFKGYTEGTQSVVKRLGTTIHTTQEANGAMGEFKAAVHAMEDAVEKLDAEQMEIVAGLDGEAYRHPRCHTAATDADRRPDPGVGRGVLLADHHVDHAPGAQCAGCVPVDRGRQVRQCHRGEVT